MSGDVAFNSIEHVVEAYVAGVPNVVSPVVHIKATDEPLIVATAGALVRGDHLGIGGSFARNGLFAAARAYTEWTVITTPDLDIIASATPRLLAFADGSASSPLFISVAGSVTKTDVLNVAEAAIGAGTQATSPATSSPTPPPPSRARPMPAPPPARTPSSRSASP